MKRAASRHTFKFNVSDFFVKNIGVMGLVVILLFLVVYMLLQRVTDLESKVMNLDLKKSSSSVPATSETTKPSEMKK